MPFAFNAVELYVVTVNGKHWTRAKELCKALEYQKTTKTAKVVRAHCSSENIRHMGELKGAVSPNTFLEWPKNSQPDEYYINEEGSRELVLKSKQPKAADFAEHLGINVHKHKYTSKEQDTLSCIIKAFNGEDMKRQFNIDGYRIDLYFLEHKLAIECDEFDHADRDIEYEVKRQNHIEEKLGCTFIRYNPEARRFNLFEVINRIIRAIYL